MELKKGWYTGIEARKYFDYLKRIFIEVIYLIYPKRCPVCDEVIHRQGSLCCDDCKDKLIYIKEPICKKCGKKIEDKGIEYCYDCGKKHKSFLEGRSVFLYNDIMKDSISRFKYKGKKEYGEFYGNEIISVLGEYIRKHNIELIIPVPIHKDKLKIRGFNQADVIAKIIGNRLNINVESNALVRTINTKPQKDLNNMQRSKNLNNAFEINTQKESYKEHIHLVNNILIVDDIYTTGATINACAKIINNFEKKNIYFVTLSIGHGK